MSDVYFDTHQNRGTETGDGGPAGTPDDREWLRLAELAYRESQEYLDNDLTNEWERGYRHFHSEHAAGSKYLSDDYKQRSRLFRPKTRHMIRSAEADAASAFFATRDVVNVAAEDDSDEMQQASAAFWNALLNYRLTTQVSKYDMDWFLTCMGAYQNTKITGVVCSKQYWEYHQVEIGSESVYAEDPEDPGNFRERKEKQFAVVRDRPVIKLIPPENLRISPTAEWVDPIRSSPYIVYMDSMYLADVEELMNKPEDKTGMPRFHKLDASMLLSASVGRYDATRQSRQGDDRRDPETRSAAERKDQKVWIHENIRRHEGQDYHYFTAGTKAMLTKPVPLVERYPHLEHGERPFAMGCGLVEAHVVHPSSAAKLVRGLQQEANEISNLRIDNVKYAMQGMTKVRSGRILDLTAIRRRTPGGIVMVRDQDDVTWDRPPDVTSSSYQEQDRINVDFDELAGTFSSGSVQTNRKLNETVGGMEILQSGAGRISEYDTRVFSESWVEPVLSQVLKMLQRYDQDPHLLALAGSKAELVQRYGIEEWTDEFLESQITVTVDVGIGATDPSRKLLRFREALTMANDILAPLGPMSAEVLNYPEILNEIFGLSGHKNGERFYNIKEDEDPDPQMIMMEEEKAALEEELAALQAELQDRDTKDEAAKDRDRQKIDGQLELEDRKSRNRIKEGGLDDVREAIKEPDEPDPFPAQPGA